MKAKLYYTPALTGVLVGLASTFPFSLGATPSFILWALAGIILGYFLEPHEGKFVIWTGILYGIFLTIFFLFSRFSGAADKIFLYSLFVIGMCIPGSLAAVFLVYIGKRIKTYRKNKQSPY